MTEGIIKKILTRLSNAETALYDITGDSPDGSTTYGSLRDTLKTHTDSVADATTFGHIKVSAGNGLSFISGLLSFNKATKDIYGSVKTGDGITNNDGVISVKAGDTAGTFCDGADKRLSDNRNPIAHSSETNAYGVGNTSVYGHCKTINDLDSKEYAAGDALSAYQGNVLDSKITTVRNTLDKLNDEMDNLKKSGVDAKASIASTLTNAGIATASDAPFETIIENLKSLIAANGIYDLGSGPVYDVSGYPGYENFGDKNFIIGYSGVYLSQIGNPGYKSDLEGYGGGTVTVSHKYNNKTGILKVSIDEISGGCWSAADHEFNSSYYAKAVGLNVKLVLNSALITYVSTDTEENEEE